MVLGHPRGDLLGRTNERRDERLLKLKIALVFRQLPASVREIQYAPFFVREIQRVAEALKHDLAALDPITGDSKSRQR